MFFCLPPLLEIVHDFYEIRTWDRLIPNQNFKVVTHLYEILVFVHKLHQSANFRLFLGHIIEIFLRTLFLALFRRGPDLAPFLDFSAWLIFLPCPGISFVYPAFLLHTSPFCPSFFSAGGFSLPGPLPLFCCPLWFRLPSGGGRFFHGGNCSWLLFSYQTFELFFGHEITDPVTHVLFPPPTTVVT